MRMKEPYEAYLDDYNCLDVYRKGIIESFSRDEVKNSKIYMRDVYIYA